MSLESFNSMSPGIGMGNLPGSIAPTDDGNQATIQDHHNQDTLTVSEQEQLMILYLANNPMLAPPNYSSSPEGGKISGVAAAGNYELKLQQIGQQVLDSWTESLKKQDEELKEYLNSDAYRVWQERNAPSEVAKKQEVNPSGAAITDAAKTEQSPVPLLDSSLLREKLANYSELVRNKDPDAVGALPFAMTSLVIPATISPGMLDTVSTRQVAVNPSVDTSVYNNMVNGLPLGAQSDMRAELGLLGAMFMVGFVNYAEARNTTDALKGNKEHSHKQLAENLAAKVIASISDPNFDKMLGGMLATTKGQKLSASQLDERIAVFKLVLLSTAMMALYASEAKHISKGDFDGMLNGTTQPRSQKEADLINAFLGVRDSGKISSTTYNVLLQGLQDYADSNPDFKSFFKVDDAFKSISNRLAVQNETAASVPINTPS